MAGRDRLEDAGSQCVPCTEKPPARLFPLRLSEVGSGDDVDLDIADGVCTIRLQQMVRLCAITKKETTENRSGFYLIPSCM